MLVVIAALGASLLTFVVSLGAGLALAGIGESGERGPGLVLTAISIAAFAAVLVLAFARQGSFAGRRKPLVFLLVLIGVLPVVAIAGAALFFAGNPLGSDLPYVDWGAFAIGTALALGAVAIMALGLGRTAELPRRPAEPLSPSLPQGVRATRPEGNGDASDDARVHHV